MVYSALCVPHNSICTSYYICIYRLSVLCSMLTMNAIFPNHISREMGNCVFSNISNLEYTVKYCLFSDALKGAFVYGFEVP